MDVVGPRAVGWGFQARRPLDSVLQSMAEEVEIHLGDPVTVIARGAKGVTVVTRGGCE